MNNWYPSFVLAHTVPWYWYDTQNRYRCISSSKFVSLVFPKLCCFIHDYEKHRFCCVINRRDQ